MNTGLNQDGRTPGITMPNGAAQEALIRKVYEDAGADPSECGFVEAHGTGTKVGDPIEATAIHNVLGKGRSARDPLFIGSIKSNIGHLEAASGIVAVIKAAMMLERGFILPNHDFKKPNSKIPWNEWHMKVPASQRPWPKNKRYISVNNFGFGGTNGHVVLERPPEKYRPQQPMADRQTPTRKLFVLTANDKASLEQLMKNTVVYLEQRPEVFQYDLMNNIAYTFCQRRSLLPWRVAIPAVKSFDLIETINCGKAVPGKEQSEPLRIGFVFTGQGAQWNAMGRELYEQYPVFSAAIDRADACLARMGATWSLVAELSKDAKTSQVGAAHISQPACTAVQLALTDLLRAWNVRPTAVTGHSSGEIGAAYAAGILTFDAAMTIAYHRGRLIPTLKERFPDLRGAMMAVGGGRDDILPLIDQLTEGVVKIACFNSPESLTISGDEPAIDELARIVESRQVFNRRLQVDTAYHSHHMNLVAKEYRECISDTDAPRTDTDVVFHSSLLARVADPSELQPAYWVENLTCPVRFDEALQSMIAPVGEHRHGVDVLVELGPHSALQGPIKQILKQVGGTAPKIPYASALVRKRDAVETALELAGALFVRGCKLNFEAINFPKPDPKRMPVLLTDLPRYPWNYSSRYWQESRLTLQHKKRSQPRSDLLGALASYSHADAPTWRNVVRLDDVPWLRHHKVQGLAVFPLSGYVGMALEAAAQRAEMKQKEAGDAAPATPYDRFELRDVAVLKPLVIGDDDAVEMTLTLRATDEGTLTGSDTWDEFRICSWTLGKGWTEHCKGLIGLYCSQPARDVTGLEPDAGARALVWKAVENLDRPAADNESEATATIARDDMYKAISSVGAVLGPVFQGLESVRARPGYSAADLIVPDIAKEMPHQWLTETVVQPAVLESLIEMYWPALGAGRKSEASAKTPESSDSGDQAASGTLYLPSSIGRLTVQRAVTAATKSPGTVLKAYCTAPDLVGQATPRPSKVSMVATAADDGSPLLEISDLLVAPILDGSSSSAAEDANAPRELCYKFEWEAVPDLSVTGADIIKESSAGAASHGGFPDANVAIVHAAESDAQQLMALSLAAVLEHATGRKPDVGTLTGPDAIKPQSEDAQASGDARMVIFLQELHAPLLARVKPDEFAALQQLITRSAGVLWVVRGAYEASSSPESNMVVGLARSIRSESALRLATLDLDAATPLSDLATTEAVLAVFRRALGSSAKPELEFSERGGRFYTPRIVVDDDTNAEVHRATNHAALEPASFIQPGRRLRIAVGAVGAKDTLHFVDDTSCATVEDGGSPLAAGEVEIEVAATGINHRDAAIVAGHDESGHLGLEVSGTVIAVGSDVTSLAVGDRVAALTPSHGGFSTVTRTPATLAFRVPDHMSFEEAATLPLAYCTAYYALCTLGRLDKGESVLIHAAAGAVGQAAVRIARSLGAAEIFCTVGTPEKAAFVRDVLRIPKENVFYSRNATSFSAAVRDATGGCGVDVVLNTLPGASSLRESWECLGTFGRFLDVGRNYEGGSPSSSSPATARLDVTRANSNASFLSVDLLAVAAAKPRVVERLVKDVSDLFSDATMQPITPLHVHVLSQTDAALRTLSSGRTHGKHVVVASPDDVVRATPGRRANDRLLRSDATYVLVGGTGGLGRSMARWMASKGARTIVLVSRSARESNEVKALMDEVKESHGATVLVRACDVADKAAVDTLVKEGLKGLPPVRGVVHGTMVLRDVLFEKMVHDEYVDVIAGKVQGGWNLHQAFSTPPSSPSSSTAATPPLDFFIAISSAAGTVGNRGQAAYSAANTFLNALVQHRLSQGLPSASLDLTAVSDAGYLAADAAKAAEVARTLGGDTICEAEVLALLCSAIQGRLGKNCNGHTVTGARIVANVSKRPFWALDSKFSRLVAVADEEAAQLALSAGNAAATVSHGQALRNATTPEEGEAAVCEGLVEKIAAVLMMERDELDITRSLSHYPLDSLVAIEIRNYITREFEANLQVLELLSSGSIQTLAKTVCGKSKLVSYGK